MRAVITLEKRRNRRRHFRMNGLQLIFPLKDDGRAGRQNGIYAPPAERVILVKTGINDAPNLPTQFFRLQLFPADGSFSP
jgi:hypothetical protein